MCVALHKAGVVLLHHDIVYLRVDDIAQAVMQVGAPAVSKASQAAIQGGPGVGRLASPAWRSRPAPNITLHNHHLYYHQARHSQAHACVSPGPLLSHRPAAVRPPKSRADTPNVFFCGIQHTYLADPTNPPCRPTFMHGAHGTACAPAR